MGRPISGKHAIEVAAFVLAFERPFSRSTIDALMTLKDSMASDYPVYSASNVVKVHLEDNIVKNPSNSICGVFLQKLTPEGRPSWSLRADVKSIIVSCHEYSTWETTSPKALEDLHAAASVAVDDRNPLDVIALQVVDRFVGSTRNSYKLNQVFNTKSKFLPKQTTQSGPLWHVHQGWFQDAEEFKAQHLNVLNLSTNETPAGIITTIDHTARLHMRPVQPAIEATNKTFIKSAFDTLHICNKNIVKELLNKKQCRAIDLC